MKKYIDKFYVITEDNKFVYEVNTIDIYDNSNAIYINLELVSGWDYIAPDDNDIQGWCKAENFVEDVQTEIITQYFIEESMREALSENGYLILKNITPTLQKIIDDKNKKE